MNLQLAAPPKWGFPRLRLVLTALICGMVFMATAAPESAFAQQVVTTAEDTPITFSVDPTAGHNVTGKSIGGGHGPFHGTVDYLGGASFKYTPATNYNGNTDSFHFTECLGGDCQTTEVEFNVTSTNDKPVAVNDPEPGNEALYTMMEDQVGGLMVNAAAGLLDNDSDIDVPADTLTAALDTGPSHGIVTVAADGSFHYTPTMDYHGDDSFTYTVFDGTELSDSAMVSVTVTSVLDDMDLTRGITETEVLTPVNNLVVVPIEFNSHGESAISLSFELTFDDSCLAPYFDAGAGEGITDAVAFAPGLPGFPPGVSQPASNQLNFSIISADLVTPIDGLLANVTFEYLSACAVNTVDFNFNTVNAADGDGSLLTTNINNPNQVDLYVNAKPGDVKRPLVGGNGNNGIDEGFAGYGQVANLQTTDLSPFDPHMPSDHSYSLEDSCFGNQANNDKDLFEIVDDKLYAKAGTDFDHEAEPQYKLCLRTTDPLGLYFEKIININVGDVDEAPTDINLSVTGIDEDACTTPPCNVGVVSDVDPDVDTGPLPNPVNDVPDSKHDYYLQSVVDDQDQPVTGLFDLNGGVGSPTPTMLRLLQTVDHETSEFYKVTIRVIDVDDPEYDLISVPAVIDPPTVTLMYTGTITVVITDVNEAPTGVTPTLIEADSSLGSGDPVDSIGALDPEGDGPFTFSLCPAHSNFAISSGGDITTIGFIGALDVGGPPDATIMVCVEDQGANVGGPFAVEIDVVDGNHPPVANDDYLDPSQWIVVGPDLWSVTPTALTKYGPANLSVLSNAYGGQDVDPDQPIDPPPAVHMIATAPVSGTVAPVTSGDPHITYMAPTNPATHAVGGEDTFSYHVIDSHGAVSVNPATVTLTYVQDTLRGDCNANGIVEAADFVLNIQEFMESTGVPWYDIASNGTRSGHPWGCNSFRDAIVNLQDVICTMREFLLDPCAGGMVRSSSVQGNAAPTTGRTVSVPLTLNNGNGTVAGAGFFIKTDVNQLTFDTTDADGNGIPDAVSMNIPSDMQAAVHYDAASGELRFALVGISAPASTLADGVIGNVSFVVNEGVNVTDSAIQTTNESFSDSSGQAVSATVSSGSATVSNDTVSNDTVGGDTSPDGTSSVEVFLPLSFR